MSEATGGRLDDKALRSPDMLGRNLSDILSPEELLKLAGLLEAGRRSGSIATTPNGIEGILSLEDMVERMNEMTLGDLIWRPMPGRMEKSANNPDGIAEASQKVKNMVINRPV
ncbi:hypothetical protein [Streptomyces sp. WMMC897]|uniref:hypothetical protein n=1 Tax=Streptomyces sp. WMMC897 TaxID=3014782 RepID=UPI0022B655FD|nr:hypothetical protein [Streptomyces sp. WMMC897]MCZ7416831.1 hypothetical protein [Streptomyces sp. WMMC897]